LSSDNLLLFYQQKLVYYTTIQIISGLISTLTISIRNKDVVRSVISATAWR